MSDIVYGSKMSDAEGLMYGTARQHKGGRRGPWGHP